MSVIRNNGARYKDVRPWRERAFTAYGRIGSNPFESIPLFFSPPPFLVSWIPIDQETDEKQNPDEAKTDENGEDDGQD